MPAASPINLPNALCLLRLAGSFGLPVLGANGHPGAFVALFVALVLTDLVDGQLATRLNQRTELGARLDSLADVVLYLCLGTGAILMRPGLMRAEMPLIIAAGSTYALSLATSLARFRSLPSYHTLGAKACWFLTGIGTLLALMDISPWPLRIALIAVVLANLEAVAISLVLTRPRSDIPSLAHALRLRQASADPT